MKPVRFKELAEVMERSTEEAAIALSMPPLLEEVAAYRLRCYFKLVFSRIEARDNLKSKIGGSWIEISRITQDKDSFLIELKFSQIRTVLHCRVPEDSVFGSIKDIISYVRYLDQNLEDRILRWYHETKQGWNDEEVIELPPFQFKEKAV